jgi:hypothetical protein
MTTDQLSLYQGALRLVGERKLSSLTEARGPRYLLDDIWADDPVKACLEAGEWAFASRSTMMEADNGVAPDFGYAYGFEKPTDWVRTISVSLDEYFKTPLKEHRDEGGFLWLDNPEVYFAYVSDDVSYGRNYALWTPSFNDYVHAYIAKKVLPTIVNSITTAEALDKEMVKCLARAGGKNALTRPTHDMPTGSWVSARLGRRDDRRSDR